MAHDKQCVKIRQFGIPQAATGARPSSARASFLGRWQSALRQARLGRPSDGPGSCGGSAVAGVPDLADALDPAGDRLDQHPLAEEQFVREPPGALRMFLCSLVMRWSPCATKSRSASGCEMEPLSPNNLPNKRHARHGIGRRSFTLPRVRQKAGGQAPLSSRCTR